VTTASPGLAGRYRLIPECDVANYLLMITAWSRTPVERDDGKGGAHSHCEIGLSAR
jgi:hypothetical protein